jgi:hypothetical protein
MENKTWYYFHSIKINRNKGIATAGIYLIWLGDYECQVRTIMIDE